MKVLLALTVAATAAFLAPTAQADLVYGFETGGPVAPDGFGPNGAPTPVVAGVAGLGVTQGTQALSFTAAPGATFVGAITGNAPAALGDTRNTLLTTDFTLPTAVPSGSFASLIAVFFGATNGPTPTFGNQVQLTDFIALEGRAAGTYTDSYTLEAFNPFTFTTTPLFNGPNAIFGPGANQYTLTGFQFVINKSIAISTTVILDNVQNNVVPEPASLGLVALGGTLLGRRRRV